MEDKRKKVVIVGGGYGGVHLSKILDDKFDVTLVERKQVFFHNITSLRLVVEYQLATKVFIPMDKLLKKGRVIHQLAVEISKDYVKLQDGTFLNFDYLVVSTGSSNMSPFKLSPSVDCTTIYPYYRDLCEKVKSAKSVLIVGGTTIGCELAGEIVSTYPGKEVTLVHNMSRLCSHRLGEKFSDELIKKMTKLGIKVMMNTVVDVPSDAITQRNQNSVVDYKIEMKSIKSDQGDIQADLVFYCLPSRPNSEPLREHFQDSIDNVGHLKVNEYLQVEGHENIFAMGDITNVSELKTAYNAMSHGKTVSKNIFALDNNKKPIKHPLSYPLIFVSLGKNKGVSNIPGGIVLGSFFTKLIKSKNTYISSVRKLLNNPKTTPNLGQ